MAAPRFFTLNNGVNIPSIGLGVFQTPPDVTQSAVSSAFRAGYRLIDTAAAYGNEREVGQAIKESTKEIEEVFVETKIWISDYGYQATLKGFEKSAKKLSLHTIDLVVLHQALPSHFDRTVESYRALETLLKEGRVRAIGVSNFMPHHLQALLEKTTVVPAVNQIEVHPYFQQKELQKFNQRHHILTQAWSPIGGITSYRGSERSVLQDELILQIAAKHRKSAAQVLLRWHLQSGRSVVPKSTRRERIAENIDVFDFSLDDDDIRKIDALDSSVRRGPQPDDITLEAFGREIPDA